jgi:Zn-dependent protease with chaperone function
MLRRAILVSLLFSASLAVVVIPAAAQLPHRHSMARSLIRGSTVRRPRASKPEDTEPPEQAAQPWWIPLLLAIPTLLFMFGAAPGIIASSKGIPNWKSYFWRGLFFGYLFFPIVLVLLYQVLKYESEPIYNQAQLRPPNVVVRQPVPAESKPSPTSFQPENNP